MHHCYMVPFVACAPHLSFLVVVFWLIMAWGFCPSMGCGVGFGLCVVVVGVLCVVCGWFLWSVGVVGGGNSE